MPELMLDGAESTRSMPRALTYFLVIIIIIGLAHDLWKESIMKYCVF